MPRDRIGRAMSAGKRWARRQIKDGIEITPLIAEEAAQKLFEHRGLQHLFIVSALEVLFEAESVANRAIGATPKAAL